MRLSHLVFTRYSFHHFPDPLAVLKEMARVCKLEPLLSASVPNPDDKERVRAITNGDMGKNELGLGVREIDGDVQFAYPNVVFAASIRR